MSNQLDVYRKKANFDWKALKNLIEGEENVRFKAEIVDKLKNDIVFNRTYDKPTLSQQREYNHARWKKLIEYGFAHDPYTDLDRFHCLLEVLETYDQGLSARLGLHANVFGSAIMSMGTDKHKKLLEDTNDNKIVGCFCLTELSHGSNTQEIMTTTTFDKGEFVIHTPSNGAVKVWAGNLAESATHAVVFSQLIVSGKNYGMHAFVLQVRDVTTFNVLPGITIGDMGEKPGAWNGVENGWMRFNNHRAPLSSLLNKGCDVTSNGEYISHYKSTSERQSVSLGALSIGRIGIIGKGVLACGMASTIAIRYSAVRKQFGETKGGEELSVIEYPLQQHRLFPFLAAHFTIKLFHKKFYEYFANYMLRVMTGEKTEELAEFSKEVHALSSSAKPVATWLGVEALAEARRACGGHGFLYSSRLNDLRDSFDPSQTFEGENNILLQQTSNIIVAKFQSGTIDTPMGSFSYLREKQQEFSGTWSKDQVQDVLSAYKWLIVHLSSVTCQTLNSLKKDGMTSFQARNNTQVHLAHTLSIAYAENTIIQWAYDYVKEVTDKSLKEVLYDLVTLYSLYSVEKHLSSLYIGGYCTGPSFGKGVREGMQMVEKRLFPNIMSLVDSCAPDDFLLNSSLGTSDGRAYENLLAEFEKHKEPRPHWWKDLSQFIRNHQSKL